MKLLGRFPPKGEPGGVKLIAEEAEDMWHAYNVIREQDQVTATTFRKVLKDTGTGSDSERVKLKLTIRVEGIDFDAQGGVIRLRGKNLTESEHIKLGAYHSIELEEQRPFSVYKESWDAVDVERLQTACDPKQSADLAVVLITEGLANICLVGASTTLNRSRIETNLPKKRGAAAAGYDKAFAKFLGNVFKAVVQHVDFSVVKCLVIAGPGFAKDEFKQFLDEEAVKQNVRPLIENKSKILTAHASSAYKHSLKDVLSAAAVLSGIKDTKAAREVQALQEFYDMLAKDPARAFYGPGHVFAAHELGAVQTLLISDNLFRVPDVKKRKKYVALVEEVRAGNGEALIFSSMHVSGEQLNQLSGIAALLRFPLPDLEDQELTFEI